MIKFIYIFFKNANSGNVSLLESYEDVKWALKFEKQYGCRPFLAFEDPNDYQLQNLVTIKPPGYAFGVICHNN